MFENQFFTKKPLKNIFLSGFFVKLV